MATTAMSSHSSGVRKPATPQGRAPPAPLVENLSFAQLLAAGSLASLVAQMAKNTPAMQETWVPSLDREDPLEKEMATHSRILAWGIAWTEEPGGLQSMRLQSWTGLGG